MPQIEYYISQSELEEIVATLFNKDELNLQNYVTFNLESDIGKKKLKAPSMHRQLPKLFCSVKKKQYSF